MIKFLNLISCHVSAQPTVWGTVHIRMMLITLLAFLGICYWAPRANDKIHRAVLFFSGVLLLAFEVIKQALLIYDEGNYQYDFHHLPFQPCSSLMYSVFLSGLLYNAKKRFWKGLRDVMLCYSMVFGFFAGMCGVVLPESLFNTRFAVLIYQSLQHHMVLTLVAIYIAASGLFRFCKQSYCKAVLAFAGYCALALVLNLVCHAIWPEPPFNMMYMGPYVLWTIPLVSVFIDINSYALHLPVYFFGFAFCAIVASAGCYGTQRLSQRLAPRVKQPV